MAFAAEVYCLIKDALGVNVGSSAMQKNQVD